MPEAAFFWAEFDSPLWLQQVSQLSFFLFFIPFNKQEQGHAMPCKWYKVSGSFPKRADLFRSQRLRPAQPRAPLVALLLTLLMRPRPCWGITGRGVPLSLNWLTTPSKCYQMLIDQRVMSPSDKPTWPPRGIFDFGVDFEVRYFEGSCLVRLTTVGFNPRWSQVGKLMDTKSHGENPRNPLVFPRVN